MVWEAIIFIHQKILNEKKFFVSIIMSKSQLAITHDLGAIILLHNFIYLFIYFLVYGRYMGS